MEFPEWAWGLVVGGAGATLVVYARKWLDAAQAAGAARWADALPPPRPGSNCQRCHHWDLHEGQGVLQKHPAFLQAASVLSPNQMMRSAVDGDGNSNAGRKRLPLAEDKWTYMGACMGHGELRHRTDGCSHFLRAGSRAARDVTPGDGDFPKPPSEPDAEQVIAQGAELAEVEISTVPPPVPPQENG